MLVATPLFLSTPLWAGGLDTACCDDLEERVNELETTLARKGNRQVSLKLTGYTNRAGLYWHDGKADDVYSVDNDNDSTRISLKGEAEINDDWSTGFVLTFVTGESASGGVSQTVSGRTNTNVGIRENSAWIDHEKLGTITLGYTAMPTFSAAWSDLSGTTDVSYAGVTDVGGGFFLRQSGVAGVDGLLQNLAWGDVMGDLGGSVRNLVRYETPDINGFSLAASWGEGDVRDVALSYAGKLGPELKMEGTIGFIDDHTTGDKSHTLLGSVALLHEPTGLNIALASGVSRSLTLAELNDGRFAKPDDRSYVYLKAGLKQRFTSLGVLALYGEFGHYRNFLGIDADEDVVADLGVIDSDEVCDAGVACLVSGSRSTIWGFGLAQHFDSAPVTLYAGYRHYSSDFDLVTDTGAPVTGAKIHDFHTILFGMHIDF